LRFRCALNPGIYFMNAGVMARVGARDGYLDRAVDALMFRVIARAQSIANGIVDFEPEGDVRILRSAAARAPE
jgi:lipopolysaccharide transport system ATP-binding protein